MCLFRLASGYNIFLYILMYMYTLNTLCLYDIYLNVHIYNIIPKSLFHLRCFTVFFLASFPSSNFNQNHSFTFQFLYAMSSSSGNLFVLC